MRADNAGSWRAVAVTPILPVTDLERSVTWFQDVMGFGVNFIDGLWASLGKDGLELLLHEVDQSPEPRWTFVHVADVDQVFEGFRSGPGLVEPVASKPWGTREFVLEAPDGHRFRIGHGE
jgi:catechol 2,3-dioxygenase-like lactoylglutathione lyase family enzyme